MSRSTLLLEHHLKELQRWPPSAQNVDHPDSCCVSPNCSLTDTTSARRIRAARSSLTFEAIPSVGRNWPGVNTRAIAVGMAPARPTWLGLGLAACQKGMSVGFTTAAALVHELMEAKRSPAAQPAAATGPPPCELGFVPLSTTGAELLFEVFSQRYERGSVLVTTNLPFDDWTDVFGSVTGACLTGSPTTSWR